MNETASTLRLELEKLISEGRNPATIGIDLMSTRDVLAAINREDQGVAAAVAATLPQVAQAVDHIVAAFKQGGRLIYLGAGSSGRLGVLDAAECPPTFGVPEGMVIGLIAGGRDALVRPIEGAEDAAGNSVADLRSITLTERDVVVGIAVSGRTPYVVGGLGYARKLGAVTVALSCNPGSPITAIAEISITPVVGPEVLAGSTRLKSGTAQKLVLNMLTTASMIRIGKSYQNLMVDLNPSNAKLQARSETIVMQATGCPEADARAALARTGQDVKLAILVIATGLEPGAARAALERADGFLRRAIEKATAA